MPVQPYVGVDRPRPFQFTIVQCMTAMGCLALGLLWLPALPVLLWLALFLGPHADWRRNLRPVLVLAIAFYLPALLCIVASEQGGGEPYLAWDHVAREYLWAAPCLPGFLAGMPIMVLDTSPSPLVSNVAIGVTTLFVLSVTTLLARTNTAMLIGLAVLALCYSVVLSLWIPAGIRI